MINNREKIYNFLVKHYKNVNMNDIVEVNSNMFSYVDKKGHKHIFRIIPRGIMTDVRTVKLDDEYKIEIVTRR